MLQTLCASSDHAKVGCFGLSSEAITQLKFHRLLVGLYGTVVATRDDKI